MSSVLTDPGERERSVDTQRYKVAGGAKSRVGEKHNSIGIRRTRQQCTCQVCFRPGQFIVFLDLVYLEVSLRT